MRAYGPNGLPIVGTYEMCPGRADTVDDSFTRNPQTGEISYDHAGWTEFFYNGQETQSDKRGKTLFLDEDGNEWPEDQIELREEEDQV